MTNPIDPSSFLLSRADEDEDFRERLLVNPKGTIQRELGMTLAEDLEIHVHEESDTKLHVVLPPRNRYSVAEREAARTGAASLAFLRKTLHDPAPPIRSFAPNLSTGGQEHTATPMALADAGRESIRRGLNFLESTVDENGAWHCIRFSTADPNIPRHFERPPFVSALCALALENSNEVRAKALCAATRVYLADTIEYPGLWRYYRHLPQDLDSSTLCSLVIETHPWVLLGRNVPKILANRDEEGRFMTWVLEDGEPDVVSSFRVEVDPVVNANVIAYLGDHPETRPAQRWLETSVSKGELVGSSKWYPDPVSIYYAIARAMIRARPAFVRLGPALLDHILGLRDERGDFGSILQAAQAVSALHNIGKLECIDMKRQAERIISSQREDGSWPEVLAFGDQTLRWGLVGQIGHGSESLTSAFCIEALERLVDELKSIAN
ncbi:MAG: hypothetical protein OXL68_12785 [Paracoccaceae bacterium]|nr:hypothetical protein [Paracoccaceae bacterium]